MGNKVLVMRSVSGAIICRNHLPVEKGWRRTRLRTHAPRPKGGPASRRIEQPGVTLRASSPLADPSWSTCEGPIKVAARRRGVGVRVPPTADFARIASAAAGDLWWSPFGAGSRGRAVGPGATYLSPVGSR